MGYQHQRAHKWRAHITTCFRVMCLVRDVHSWLAECGPQAAPGTMGARPLSSATAGAGPRATHHGQHSRQLGQQLLSGRAAEHQHQGLHGQPEVEVGVGFRAAAVAGLHQGCQAGPRRVLACSLPELLLCQLALLHGRHG